MLVPAEGKRQRQRGAVVVLRQLALDELLAVVALHVRKFVDLEAFFGDVGQHVEHAAGLLMKIIPESQHPGFIGGKAGFLPWARRQPMVGGQPRGVEKKQAAGGHGIYIFSLVMVSYTGPSTESITQPRIRPRTMVIAGSISAWIRPMDSRTSRP